MSCPHTISLGAYLLGGLEPTERVALDAHLGDCDSCRAELVRLAPLPGLLHQLPEEEFDRLHADDLPPADGVVPQSIPDEPAVVTALPVAADPASPRAYRLLAAAAVLVVGIGLGAAGVLAVRPAGGPTAAPPTSSSAPAPASPVAFTARDAGTGVGARIAATEREWGTAMEVTVSDEPPGRQCALMVYKHDGSREVAGWWSTRGGELFAIPAATSFDLTSIDRFEVVTDDRTPLVTVYPRPGR